MIFQSSIRQGLWNGKLYNFTHRNPKNGFWYTPDTLKGTWVDPQEIKWNVDKPKKRKRGKKHE